MSKLLTILNLACCAVAFLFWCLAVWNGIRIEIGKPGDKAHILLEMYSMKRLFK